LTDVPADELAEYEMQLKNNTVNPMVLKKRLAREIVTQLYDENAAQAAETNFESRFQKRELPKDIPEIHIKLANTAEPLDLRAVDFTQKLVDQKLVTSRSEFIRLINQGAVKYDGEKIANPVIPVKNGGVISIGKLRNVKLIIEY